LAQASSPFLTGATALQTSILAWLTPIAIILVMVLGAMAMANRMLKSLAARIVFAPKDYSDAREISDELGFTTVTVKSISRPRNPIFHSRVRASESLNLSEERRALLLPQEVKELGTEEAIVFYEGLRPIRCRKIRYFDEKVFRHRVRPPPPGPIPPGSRSSAPRVPTGTEQSTGEAEPGALPITTTGSEAPPSTAVGSHPEGSAVIREATLEDIERIDALTLEDFAADFSRVPMPQREGLLSESEMDAAVDQFMGTLRGR
jgi:type IV secretion system protein VirD4